MATAPVSRRLNLTRDQLATFLTDQQQIRQFELLFSTVDQIQVIVGTDFEYQADNAAATANDALAQISRLAHALELLALAPRSELGTLSPQNSDNVKITGGEISGLDSPLPVASGGTGQSTFTDGQLLIGNNTGNTLTKATLTPGANITITNAAGAITIAVSGLGTMAFQNVGISGTAALAKLTALGADGSLTFSNGIITGYVAPT
jgi:hypothetical protein